MKIVSTYIIENLTTFEVIETRAINEEQSSFYVQKMVIHEKRFDNGESGIAFEKI